MARLLQIPLLLLTTLSLVTQAQENQEVWRKFIDIEQDHAFFPETLQFAIQQYNKDSNDEYLYQMTQLIRAQEQLSRGFEYLVNMELSRTMCTKDVGFDPDDCGLQKDPELYKVINCTFFIFAVPWDRQYELRSSNCTNI
ncbi:cystatin-like isoform X2 [Phascolarctos cinereus]|uniref:Cystatin-like isoform X2 n=1 Tax=Phascolarctos cinereus TaxID=38626 RepID=A0A6P5KBC0_PHACI|nr:cystatin-like isoform X2 [Phascolarctos cinereus]